MDAPKLVWGATNWLAVALGSAGIIVALLILGYRRAGDVISGGVRYLAIGLKIIAVVILATCLMEPLFSGTRARPGANKFAILADNSQSMTLKDEGSRQSRADELKSLARKDAPWLEEIGRNYDLRQFSFDSQLRTTDDLATLTFDGRSSDMGVALERLLKRYQGQPLAGIMLLTDGSATDADNVEKILAEATAAGSKVKAPPIYPVLMGGRTSASDISVENITVTQTNFEDAPVTITAQLMANGEKGNVVAAELIDETGKTVAIEKSLRIEKDSEPVLLRFKVKPEKPGLSFYQVRAAVDGQFAEFDHPETSTEATLANNIRMTAVDRGKGPYKILYVAGRMVPDFKFLQRAVSIDEQIELTGLIRVAKREPKFNFISRDTVNPLFQGFDPGSLETAEQFDQPIVMRVTQSGDKIEPHVTFPKTAEELDAFHAVILDHLESEFFTPDQMALLKEFVRQRGGGLLMLGGEESFKNGKYDKTAIGDVLPVYVDDVPSLGPDATFRMYLAREGKLEPWLRLRDTGEAEDLRISGMPGFTTFNAIRGIKPGATVLARAISDAGLDVPALVEQKFGRGRSAALMIGDLWKWQLHRPIDTQNDFDKAWRQMVRWLVSDVPQRIEAAVSPSRDAEDAAGTMKIVVQVRDPVFAPLDNANVSLKVTPPDGKAVTLRVEPSLSKAGQYETAYVPHEPGPYRAELTVKAADNTDIGETTTGWTSDPAAEEFRVLQPNMALLERIAKATNGKVIEAADVGTFASALPTMQAQITEPYVQPFWHQSWIFLIAIACLAMEWALRRWRGLP